MKRFSIWKMALRLALKVIIVALILILMIGPLVGIVLWSFARRWYWPSPIPQEFTLKFWLEVFEQGRVLDSLVLSVTVALITVAFSLALALPAAYGFARYKLPMERVLLILFLMPQAFPQLPVFINLASIFGRIGLRGNMWGIILAHTMASLVFSLWIITATFKSIPLELEQAAQNLGASRFKVFWTITFPLAIPGLIAGSIFVFFMVNGRIYSCVFHRSTFYSNSTGFDVHGKYGIQYADSQCYLYYSDRSITTFHDTH